MLNLKILQLRNTIQRICQQSIADGVPVYVVSLVLEQIINDEIKDRLDQAIQEEYEKLNKEAIPDKNGPVTKDIEEGEK